MRTFMGQVDRIAGKIYNRVLAIALSGVAVFLTISGLLFIGDGGIVFGLLWLAGGLGFGLLARWLWRSRATLSDTLDNHA